MITPGRALAASTALWMAGVSSVAPSPRAPKDLTSYLTGGKGMPIRPSAGRAAAQENTVNAGGQLLQRGSRPANG